MIKRHPVVSYVVLTFLITWPFHIAGFIAADRAGTSLSNEDNFHHFSDLVTLGISSDALAPYLIYNIGQSGPVLAAFILTGLIYGSAGIKDLSRRLVKWRVPLRWYTVVLLLPFILIGISLGAAFVSEGFQVGPFDPRVPWTLFIPFVLYMVVFTGLAEEPGWRGFALPHLQAKHSAYRSSWILGLIWGAWHYPFIIYYNLDQPALLIPALFGLTFGIIGWTIVNNWVYNNTSSVLLIIILHGWAGALQSYLILPQGNFLAQTLYSVVPWGIAILLIKRYGAEDLAHVPRPKWWPGTYATEQLGELVH